MMYGQRIPIKTRDEVRKMRVASRHVAEILLELREMVLPGVTTKELDDAAEKMISERGVVSSFKGYGPQGLPEYPAVLCVSVNEEIVHGIPGLRTLEEGDIVGLDFGVRDRNAAVEPFDAAVLEAFGMTSFATLVPGGRK